VCNGSLRMTPKRGHQGAHRSATVLPPRTSCAREKGAPPPRSIEPDAPGPYRANPEKATPDVRYFDDRLWADNTTVHSLHSGQWHPASWSSLALLLSPSVMTHSPSGTLHCCSLNCCSFHCCSFHCCYCPVVLHDCVW